MLEIIELSLLLNIIFGIIIDTFGQLREESTNKNLIMVSNCFICGISKDVFDLYASNENTNSGNNKMNSDDDNDGNGGGGGSGGSGNGKNNQRNSTSNFSEHIENVHNMWNYMLYILYLQEKNKNDFNGIESYVYELYESDDISWIPKGITKGIQGDDVTAAQTEEIFDKNNENMLNQIKTLIETNISKNNTTQMNENNKICQLLYKLENNLMLLTKANEKKKD